MVTKGRGTSKTAHDADFCKLQLAGAGSETAAQGLRWAARGREQEPGSESSATGQARVPLKRRQAWRRQVAEAARGAGAGAAGSRVASRKIGNRIGHDLFCRCKIKEEKKTKDDNW
jgi:hypothetical protein